MKKYIVIFSVLLLFSSSILAQQLNRDSVNAVYAKKHRWRLSVASGYGLSVGGDVLGYANYFDDRSVYVASEKELVGTCGQGSWSFAEVIYMVRPHFGLMAGGYYFNGKATRVSYAEDLKTNFESHDATDISIQSPGPQLGFIFSDTLKHRFYISCQSEILAGIGNRATMKVYHDDNYMANTSLKTTIETQGVSWGWVNRAGVSFKWGQRWETGLQGFIVLESWAPRKAKVKDYVVNGTSQLSTLPQGEQEYNLVGTYTYNPIGPASTGIALRVIYPFHSAGLLLHVSYRI